MSLNLSGSDGHLDRQSFIANYVLKGNSTNHSPIGSKKEKEGGITQHLVSPVSKVMGLTQSFQNLISINSSASGLFQFFSKLFGKNRPEGSECSQPCDLSKVGELERFWLSHRWLHDPMPIT